MANGREGYNVNECTALNGARNNYQTQIQRSSGIIVFLLSKNCLLNMLGP